MTTDPVGAGVSGSRRGPRVAVVCRAMGSPGSVASVAVRQADELAKYLNVTLISDELPGDGLGEPGRIPIASRTYRWLRRFGHVPRERAFAASVRRALRAEVERDRVAAVLCHSHAVAALAASRLRSCLPYALVVHGDIYERPAGMYDRRLTRFYRRMTPLAYRSAARVIALSPATVPLAARWGVAERRIRVIPNGIAAEDFGLRPEAPWSPPGESGPLRILFVGRIGVEKGLDVLLEAFARLLSRGCDARLEIVGTGPREADTKRRLSTSPAAGAITWRGVLPRRELAEVYEAADVVCVPSGSDVLPTVALEAGRAGRAVVCSDVGGLPFIVRDGESGRIFPSGDPEALETVLSELASDRPLLMALGAGGRERTLREFTWSRVGEELASLMRSMIEQSGAEPC